MNKDKALELTGATYRQLDYWTRKGYIRVEGKGSGRQREWPSREVKIASLIKLLSDGGFEIDVAAGIARKFISAREKLILLESGPPSHFYVNKNLSIHITIPSWW